MRKSVHLSNTTTVEPFTNREAGCACTVVQKFYRTLLPTDVMRKLFVNNQTILYIHEIKFHQLNRTHGFKVKSGWSYLLKAMKEDESSKEWIGHPRNWLGIDPHRVFKQWIRYIWHSIFYTWSICSRFVS